MIDAAFKGKLGSFFLDAAFQIPAMGVTGLFGPSGCGKTTILRCMAGLQRLPGKLIIAGEIWQDEASGVFKKPHERPIGYVFQEPSLFSHLSVRKNLLYGVRRSQKAALKHNIASDDVFDLLGLRSLLDRSPAALSGGERQRVAIGRALMSQPRVLLLDEPLSALDRSTKEDILPYLEGLYAALGIPALYVSHDIGELERLADTLVLVKQGRVIASGPLAELEADPSLPLMRAPEAAVTLTGRIVEIDEPYGLCDIAVDGGVLIVPEPNAKLDSLHRLRIKASDVSFTRVLPVETSVLNCLPARIVSVNPQESDAIYVNIVAALGEDGRGSHILGRVTRKSQESIKLALGEAIFVQIKSVALNLR